MIGNNIAEVILYVLGGISVVGIIVGIIAYMKIKGKK